jgi:diguanylate cyclase
MLTRYKFRARRFKEATIVSDDNKKPLFGSLFSKDNTPSASETTDKDLKKVLVTLSQIYIGQDTRIDAEIGKFKKMLQVGSAIEDLQQQVAIIARQFGHYEQEKNNNKDWFKKLPAKDFITVLISSKLEKATETKLRNYMGSLEPSALAMQALPDIIDLLTPDDMDTVTTPIATTSLSPEQIRNIAAPIVKLLHTIELEQGQLKQTAELLDLAEALEDDTDLCKLLEGVSDFIISSINSTNDQFESFLDTLKKRLSSVDEFILINNDTSKAISDCSDTLSDEMNKQVGELKIFITNSQTLEELESNVKTSIEHIMAGLAGFNEQRKQLEEQASAQIQQLQEELSSAKSETELLRDNLHQQRQRALTDPLTRLPNRHAYNERLHLEYNRWRRYQKPLTLIIADIDHFKMINDNYGHSIGDDVLANCARILASGLRDTDFIGRYGGEEFVILLPETAIKEAIKAMNKLRVQIMDHQYNTVKGDFSVTMSFGVATFETNDDFNLVFNRADTALYRAKTRGRNQVCAELKKNV